jgi:gliding motility-associated-like protein
MRTSIVNTYFFCFLYLVFSLTIKTHAQSIATQILPFERICAGNDNNNRFNASFGYSSFPVGTTFQVILSDSSGSFTNPTSTTTLSVIDISGQQTIEFAIPSTLIGSDSYKLRVKSSTGFISGNFQVKNPLGGTLTSFPVYYKPYEGVYFINNKQQNATICTGGNVVLSIDNPTPNVANSSPANYPNIRYKWYKDDIAISGQTGSSLVVSALGIYYVTLDYGPCTETNSRSNEVAVIQSAGGGPGFVSSSLGNPICSGAAMTTLSSITGNTYQWYKNNSIISGATNTTYDTNQAGLYSVKINFGGCISTYSIDLKEFSIKSTINISNPTTIKEGDTKTVVVTTNAVNPTFEWYKDNTLILTNNTNTYEVTSEGSYLVKVIQNSGCVIVNELPFDIKIVPLINVVAIPNLISPNNDGKNDFWDIPQEYVNNNTQVMILDSNGEIVFTTDNYNNWPDQNNWPDPNNPINFKSVNPVYYYIMTAQSGEVKKGSITIVK